MGLTIILDSLDYVQSLVGYTNVFCYKQMFHYSEFSDSYLKCIYMMMMYIYSTMSDKNATN